MRVGLDSFALHPLGLGPMGQLDYCRQHGFAGIQFGGVSGLMEGQGPARLREVRQHADAAGLYTHVSVTSPNPHASGRTADDVVTALEQEIPLAASCGWHELHSALGAARERYELSVPWSQQLADSGAVLRRVAPVLRQHASRIDLEPHGDTTTFELARLCEALGPDVVGVCLDTANVLLFGEEPVAAVRRVAPFTHLTHTKDAILFFCERGLMRQGRPVGSGCVPWETVLPILAQHTPDLPLSIEDHKWFFSADIFDPQWLAGQADLSRDELAATVRIAWETQARIHAGEVPDPQAYEAVPYADEMHERLAGGRDYLNALLGRLGL